MWIDETEKELSTRIHFDWYGKCRTCRSWSGDRMTMKPGMCMCGKSELFGAETWTEGHCPEWYTFDEDTLLEIMESEDGRASGPASSECS